MIKNEIGTGADQFWSSKMTDLECDFGNFRDLPKSKSWTSTYQNEILEFGAASANNSGHEHSLRGHSKAVRLLYEVLLTECLACSGLPLDKLQGDFVRVFIPTAKLSSLLPTSENLYSAVARGPLPPTQEGALHRLVYQFSPVLALRGDVVFVFRQF